MPLDRKLLDLLVCPVCRVRVSQAAEALECPHCGRRYPVRDGIPVMLAEQAQTAERKQEGGK